MSKNLPTSDNYINREINNPFAKILCSSRTLVATVCDGTCGGCKKDRSKFLEEKVQGQLDLAIKDPQYGDGADHTTPLDISQIEKGIRERVTAAMKKIEQQKQEKVELVNRVNDHMDGLYIQLLSSETPTTLQ